MAWYNNYQEWLNETQKLNNAQLMINRLIKLGWSKNAMCALCGNAGHESSCNPNMYEFGFMWEADRGFGLLQWTPRSKYWNWALENGYSESVLRNGEAQMDRVEYEAQNGIQWISTTNYPLSFREFTQSNESIDYLTQAFTWNYERPNEYAGIESTPERIAFAKKCAEVLDFSGTATIPVSDGTQLAKFPADYIDTTQGEFGSFTHYSGSNQEYAIDFIFPTERYKLYAPFDCECINVYNDYAQVIWRSTVPVMSASGKRYEKGNVCITFVHDWEFNRWKIGDTLKKGEFIAESGSNVGLYGHSTGDHSHMQAFNASYHPWPTPLDKQIHLYDLFDTSDVNIVDGGGYPWKQSNYQEGGTNDTETNPPPAPPEEKPKAPAPPSNETRITGFLDNFSTRLEDLLTVDVYKVGQSEYYKNSFLTLTKQMDNTYKIKPNIELVDELKDKLDNLIRDILP